jgi:hypothetical protein
MRQGIYRGYCYIRGRTQLTPIGSSNAQAIPDFKGDRTNKIHSGHWCWLPDQIALPASPTAWMTARGFAGNHVLQYTEATDYKVISINHGIGSNRTTNVTDMVTGTLPSIKAAITAGDIDPFIAVWPQGMDPSDSNNIDLWGNDAFDGSYPFRTMYRRELIPIIPEITRAARGAANHAVMGFSRGAMVTAGLRAEFDTTFAAAYVSMGGPRMTGDFPSTLSYFNTFSANEKTKCFNNVEATCVARSPITSSGLGLFDQFGDGVAPFRCVKSANDATTLNSMNQFDTRLTASGITHLFIDLSTPTHSASSYFTTDSGDSFAWIQSAAGW